MESLQWFLAIYHQIFLAKFPDDEVILATYSSSLAYDFSRYGRTILSDHVYQVIYPGMKLAPSEHSVQQWGIENHMGKACFSGIGGSIVGKGANLLILDDFFKSREEAESAVIRNKIWESFTNDLLTRLAPTSIVIILATPWHIDDIFGRINNEMKKDDNFPQFEELIFPAFSDEYPTGTLFPERFNREWYDGMKATLGTYGTASLMQCDPQPRTGVIFRTDKINILDPADFPTEDLRFARGWDLASSVKERLKTDPDYTVGVKSGIKTVKVNEKVKVPMIFIDDVVRGRWEASERDKRIINVAMGDGTIKIGIEAFGAYKDAYTSLKKILSGIRSVSRINLSGDKLVKADTISPIFEAGNVFMKKADWNREFIDELQKFPSSSHDDQVDGTVVSYHTASRGFDAQKIVF